MNEERIQRILGPTPDGYYSIVHAKKIIAADLCKDADIIELLNNTELQEKNAPPEDYLFKNIYPFLKVPDIQSTVKNFICFDIDDVGDLAYNNAFLHRQIKIRVMSHEQDVKTPWGVPRQDILAMMIEERMNWSDLLGIQMKKVYDSAKIAENGYYYRNMYFDQIRPDGLQFAHAENMLDYKGRSYYSVEDSFD